MSQLLIKNGKVFTGDPHTNATIKNILVENGKIKLVEGTDIATGDNTTVIDATGKWVTPGFIDTHTHYDAEVIASPGLKESARHGVTTVIMGSCSVSAIYNNAEDTSDSFTRVEAIPRQVMLPLLEKEKTWSTPKEWVDYIDKKPLGINIASFIGHSDIRIKAMGLGRSVSDNEKATTNEKAEMEAMLNDALDNGFLGLSTMDNPWDKMDGEKYWSHKTPSFYASWKERKGLIRILRERDAILQGAPNLVTRVSAFNYILASAGLFRKKRLKSTMIALMDLIGDRYILPVVGGLANYSNNFLKADFRMQSPPAPFTVYYDGVDSVMFEEFPSGEALRHLAKNIDRRNEKIRDPKFRENFKREIRRKFAPKVWHKDLSKSIILKCPDESLIGKNFFQVAEEKNVHPVDAFLDLIVIYDKKISWTTTIANDRPSKYHELYNHKSNLISFSDAGAHLNNMAFYDFPIQMMKRVIDASEQGDPIMSMEKCVWRLTKELADWFNIDAGEITEGMPADIVIINPEQFKNVNDDVIEAPIEEFDNYPRLVTRHPNLIENVIVNGNIIYENDEFVEGYGKTKKTGIYKPGKAK
ncbi:MAG: amidohydrolase family protein [Bacteroidetes bacterium]|nr:amidohydrolase family protein [Bacteroidota bacterium]